jgi:hypothetical protein
MDGLRGLLSIIRGLFDLRFIYYFLAVFLTTKDYLKVRGIKSEFDILDTRWSIDLVFEISFAVIIFLLSLALVLPFVRHFISIWTSSKIDYENRYYRLSELRDESVNQNNSVMHNEYLRLLTSKEKSIHILNLQFANGLLLVSDLIVFGEFHVLQFIIALILLTSVFVNTDSYDQTSIRKRVEN